MVAPTTLLTVLLFYFGRVHTQAMFRYLRVPFTVLDIAPEDYLVRSADGLFVPASVVATVTVLLCWGRYLVVGTFSARAQFVVVRVTTPLVLLGGIGLVGYAVVAIVLGDAAFPGFPEGGGLALASGVLLLACAVRLVRGTVRRRRPNGAEQEPPGAVIEWGAIFVVVGVGLFWAINSYAVGVGTSRGEQISEELGSSPDVVLQREKPQPPGAGCAGGALSGPRRRVPLPLRRPEIRPPVRGPIPLHAFRLAADRRSRLAHPPHRRASVGVRRTRPNQPDRVLLSGAAATVNDV